MWRVSLSSPRFVRKFDSSPAIFLLCGSFSEGGIWSCRGVAATRLFKGAAGPNLNLSRYHRTMIASAMTL